jgi:MerR family transcriptional regulator/heat shock protein HspR
VGFDIDPEEPVYVIGVVSRLIRIPIWTLRVLDREGIVRPKRRGGRARLYSLADLRRLTQVRTLIIEKGVNLEGVRVILRMRISD